MRTTGKWRGGQGQLERVEKQARLDEACRCDAPVALSTSELYQPHRGDICLDSKGAHGAAIPAWLPLETLTFLLQKFYLSVVLCKTTTVDALVPQIRQKIRKEHVIDESRHTIIVCVCGSLLIFVRTVTKAASDPDVVATSQNLSLKCPITYMRLTNPCRGVKCNHIQCFDASSYLQMQEQSPLWVCPICNKVTPFEQLAIDE